MIYTARIKSFMIIRYYS